MYPDLASDLLVEKGGCAIDTERQS